jgi:U4/U6 small nuclear ribonucleoprotein PRP3
MSNLMRVLGSQTVADPSALEQKVRAAAAQRVKNHEMRNMARKLTPAERKDKMKKKQERDADEAIWVALFCVGSLDNPKVRFKIDINAQQTMLTGQALMVDDWGASLIVVEGGPRAVRRFVRLMMLRIRWGQLSPSRHGVDAAKEEIDSASPKLNFCRLVWKGEVRRRTFKGFRFEVCPDAQTARRALELRGVPHYWDACAQR